MEPFLLRPPPLIVCVKLDASSQERLNGWRTRYFPAQRNYLSAHLTLYHSIPGERGKWALEQLEEVARTTEIFPLSFLELERNRGFVGVKIEPTRLWALKLHLDKIFVDCLLLLDKQRLRPHVTVTNKVTADEGQLCFAELSGEFAAWSGRALGFSVYTYRGGPWEPRAEFPFLPEKG